MLMSQEAALPFERLGFDCDYGSEVPNWHLVRCFHDSVTECPAVPALRIRSYTNLHIPKQKGGPFGPPSW